MDKLIPVIPIRDGIIFPNTDSVLTFGRPKSLAALEFSFQQERIVCFVLQKNSRENDLIIDDLYEIRTLYQIKSMIYTFGAINAQVRGIYSKAILRERLKTIEKELGEDEGPDETQELLAKVKKAGMPEEVEEKTKKEIKKLSQMNQFNPEAGYIRNYVEWLVDLPWSKESKDTVELKNAEKILEEDHFGLEKVKERILEYLAVSKLISAKANGRMKGPILCFVGPPGVGKTSLGKSIARALGRKFVKVSLGGIRDEAEIRGHRRTYVG